MIAVPVGAGDKISAEVFAKYVAYTNDDNPTIAIASLLIAALTNAPITESMNNAITGNYNSGSLLSSGNGTYNSSYPDAFLNIMFLPQDAGNTTTHFAFDQIKGGLQDLNTTVKAAHYKMEINNFTAKEKGIVIIYLSNENSKLTEVYFDDLKITVNEHPVIQADDYYPFGLSFNSFKRSTNTENRFKYNGIEFQPDFNLNLYQTFFRLYDCFNANQYKH